MSDMIKKQIRKQCQPANFFFVPISLSIRLRGKNRKVEKKVSMGFPSGIRLYLLREKNREVNKKS